MKNNIFVALAAIIISVAVIATLTSAFSGPQNNPTDANSSTGALLDQMAGGNFNNNTDSLKAISDQISNMGL